jgi:hypothetical protein
MGSTTIVDPAATSRAPTAIQRLYVAWQDPTSRAMVPVGRLDRLVTDGNDGHEFRYLRSTANMERFRPFVAFPELARTYRSDELFPFFENRLMPRARHDYPEYVAALGLTAEADPFEVLARSEGRRETDTIEVFPEPTFSGGFVRCHLLVHGIRYVPGAQEAIDTLQVGDQLSVVLDPQNPNDARAILLRDDTWQLLGWVPRYLTELVHTPLDHLGPSSVEVRVAHVGHRDGPVHLRLLCALEARWPAVCQRPFTGPEFEPIRGA